MIVLDFGFAGIELDKTNFTTMATAYKSLAKLMMKVKSVTLNRPCEVFTCTSFLNPKVFEVSMEMFEPQVWNAAVTQKQESWDTMIEKT